MINSEFDIHILLLYCSYNGFEIQILCENRKGGHVEFEILGFRCFYFLSG